MWPDTLYMMLLSLYVAHLIGCVEEQYLLPCLSHRLRPPVSAIPPHLQCDLGPSTKLTNITSHRSASDTPRHLPSSPTPPIRRSLSVLSFRSAPGSPLHSIPASIITPCVQIPGTDVVADPCTPPINYSHSTVRNDIQKTESVTASQRTPVSGLRSSPNSPSGPLIVTSRSESHAYVFLPDDSSLTSPNSVQV